jgi:hypothetical protein
MSRAEIVTRRRKWRPEEKAALPAEVEAEGGGSVSSLTAGEGPLRVAADRRRQHNADAGAIGASQRRRAGISALLSLTNL